MRHPLEETNASRANNNTSNNNSNNANSLEISDDDDDDEHHDDDEDDEDGCKGVLTEVYVRWPPVCDKHASRDNGQKRNTFYFRCEYCYLMLAWSPPSALFSLLSDKSHFIKCINLNVTPSETSVPSLWHSKFQSNSPSDYSNQAIAITFQSIQIEFILTVHQLRYLYPLFAVQPRIKGFQWRNPRIESIRI